MKTDIETQTRDKINAEYYYTNGLGILVTGIGMLMFSLAILTTTFYLYAACIPLFIFYNYARKHIIFPRIGYAQLNLRSSGKKELLILLSILTLFSALGIMLLLGCFTLSASQRLYATYITFGIAFLIFLYLGLKNSIRSSYLARADYRARLLIFAPAILILKISDIAQMWLWMAYGLVMTIVGGILLVRFIKTHPVLEDET